MSSTFASKKAASYLGFARISLQRLDFFSERSAEEEGEVKKAENATARLLKVFQLEGCLRLEPENYIDALISRFDFECALRAAGLTENEFKEKCRIVEESSENVIELKPENKVQCLEGLHRIQAAQSYLDNNDKWWVIKLYDRARKCHSP